MKHRVCISLIVCIHFSTGYSTSTIQQEDVRTIIHARTLQEYTQEELLILANFFHISMAMSEKKPLFSKSYGAFVHLLGDFSNETEKHIWNPETIGTLSEAFNTVIKNYFEYLKTFVAWRHCVAYLETYGSVRIATCLEKVQTVGQYHITTFCADYFPQISVLTPMAEDAQRRGKLFLSIGYTLESLVQDTFPFEKMENSDKNSARFDILSHITNLSNQEAFGIFEANELLVHEVEKVSRVTHDLFVHLYETIGTEFDKRAIPHGERKLLFNAAGFIPEAEQRETLP